MIASAVSYTNGPVKFPALQVVDLKRESTQVAETYRNQVVNRVNRSCLRLSVFEGEYFWHRHPGSDELFVVVEGCLVIELKDGDELRLGPWECVTIPANILHRTRAVGRTVNLCFEELGAETVFEDQATS